MQADRGQSRRKEVTKLTEKNETNTKSTQAISDGLRAALQRHDLAEVLRARGYVIRADRKIEPNPLREDPNPSLHVGGKEQHRWFDFGTREGGDLIDFLIQAEGMTQGDAVREAERILNVTEQPQKSASLKSHTAKSELVQDYTETMRQAHKALTSGTTKTAHEARAYLKHRGIDLENGSLELATLSGLGVIDETVKLPEGLNEATYRGRITFPYVSNERVPFFNARAIGEVDQTEKFRKPSGASQNLAFLSNRVDPEKGYVILVEAELDALSVLRILGTDAPVLAAGGGYVKPDHLANVKRHANVIFTLYDADAAGDKFRAAAETALESFGGKVRHLHLPGGAKDVNEALSASQRGELHENLTEYLEQQIRTGLNVSDELYIAEYLKDLAERYDRKHVNFPTGLATIDALLDGGYSEGLHVLGGITGGGKTSFALRLSLNNALQGRPVLYATFEQSKRELWNRIAAALTGLPFQALKSGRYIDRDGEYVTANVLEQHAQFHQVKNAAKTLVIVEAGDALSMKESVATVDDLHRIAASMKREHGIAPLVVIDYLQRMPAPLLAGRDVRERVAHAAGLLQVGLARELGATVLALSSLNRDGYKIDTGKTTANAGLAALKEAGEVEYTAHTVSLLTGFEEGAEPAGLMPPRQASWKPKTLQIVKNREGRLGEALLKFEPRGENWSEGLTKEELW